jgi:hypothetical protein
MNDNQLRRQLDRLFGPEAQQDMPPYNERHRQELEDLNALRQAKREQIIMENNMKQFCVAELGRVEHAGTNRALKATKAYSGLAQNEVLEMKDDHASYNRSLANLGVDVQLDRLFGREPQQDMSPYNERHRQELEDLNAMRQAKREQITLERCMRQFCVAAFNQAAGVERRPEDRDVDRALKAIEVYSGLVQNEILDMQDNHAGYNRSLANLGVDVQLDRLCGPEAQQDMPPYNEQHRQELEDLNAIRQAKREQIVLERSIKQVLAATFSQAAGVERPESRDVDRALEVIEAYTGLVRSEILEMQEKKQEHSGSGEGGRGKKHNNSSGFLTGLVIGAVLG